LEKIGHSICWDRLERKCSIGVIGDIILDEYLSGSVQRISPEAPVPVHLVQEANHTAGGAANVARNIHFVGGEALLYGLCGQDPDGDRLLGILESDGISTDYVIRDSATKTIKKTRITSSRQQLLRIDWESIGAISKAYQAQLVASLATVNIRVLLVSDYGKGCLPEDFLADLIKFAHDRDIKVLVDPKGHNYRKYCGSFLVTPNWKEACEALAIDPISDLDPRQVALDLRDNFGIENVIVTLGERGMVGARAGDSIEDVFELPAETREVFDVSGAGDTVVAILALAMAAEFSLQEAMLLANIAAGLVVEKWGTQPVQLDELKAAVVRNGVDRYLSSNSKVCSLDTAKSLLGKRGQRGRQVIFTNGCFDLLHAGHVSYLEKARAQGDILVVAVNSDESVARLKGPKRPLIPLEQRLSVLAALGCVDMVVPFYEDTPKEVINLLEPDILVKGADYSLEQIVGAEAVLRGGGRVETIDFLDGISTSSIIEKALS